MKKTKFNFLKNILFPHIVFLIIFIPVSLAFLIYSLIFLEYNSPIRYISYILSFYTLLIFSIKTYQLIKSIRYYSLENKFLKRLLKDAHLRINISLYGTTVLNTAYSIFCLGLGFYHSSLWYYSISIYYILLALMRFFLLKHTRSFAPSEKIKAELVRYGITGIVLLIMNITLAVIVFFMVSNKVNFIHHEITTIALAAYTFTAFTVAIINTIKYRKYNSPVFSASKILSLISASVSMLTLEATMLSTFGENENGAFSQIMLAISGVAIFVFIGTMAIFMIIKSIKLIKLTKQLQEKM